MAKEKVTYDPFKKYTWEEDSKFELTGQEFGVILNTFRTFLNTPQSQQVLIISRANEIIEGLLAKTVEEGGATEMVPPSHSPGPVPGPSKTAKTGMQVVDDKKE